jgi:hypothetical protein
MGDGNKIENGGGIVEIERTGKPSFSKLRIAKIKIM